MPQLNPAPWFLILALSWLIFLIVVPQKILAHPLPKKPAPQNPKTLKTSSWDWPWH